MQLHWWQKLVPRYQYLLYIPVLVPVHMRSSLVPVGSRMYTAWRHAPYYQCRYRDLCSKYYRYRIVAVLVLSICSVPVPTASCTEGTCSYRELDSVSTYCRVDAVVPSRYMCVPVPVVALASLLLDSSNKVPHVLYYRYMYSTIPVLQL